GEGNETATPRHRSHGMRRRRRGRLSQKRERDGTPDVDGKLDQEVIEPCLGRVELEDRPARRQPDTGGLHLPHPPFLAIRAFGAGVEGDPHLLRRSEEHTSELQSRGHLVCRLLLEIKFYVSLEHS